MKTIGLPACVWKNVKNFDQRFLLHRNWYLVEGPESLLLLIDLRFRSIYVNGVSQEKSRRLFQKSQKI